MMTVALLLLLGVVEGRVLDERTGAGVAKAAVRLMARQDRVAAAVLTERDGRFRIEGVDDGRYMLEIDHQDYTGRWKAGLTSPRVVEIGKARELKDLRYRLAPLGVLAGRVLDEERAPMRSVGVMALSRVEEQGIVLWQRAGYGRTDDRGEYRLDSLPPGDYVLLALAQREKPPKMAALTFFPRTSRIESAAVLKVEAGDVREGLEMMVHLEPVRSLKGRVELEKGEADVRVVILGMLDADGVGSTSQSTKKGEFEFKDLPGGEYLLIAGNAEKRYALQPVKLTMEDRESLVLKLQPLPTLRGRVEGLEDGANVKLVARGSGWREGAETRSGKNGEFELGLLPGGYLLQVQGLKEGFYVEGGGTRRVEAPDDEELVLTVKAGTGELLCFASPGEEIRLEGEGEKRIAVGGIEGMVNVKNLPPGKYRVTGEAGKTREVTVEPKLVSGIEVAR